MFSAADVIRIDTEKDFFPALKSAASILKDGKPVVIFPEGTRSKDVPNEEYAGLGNAIRQQRKENLKIARQKRLAYYRSRKEGGSNYELDQESASNSVPVACFEKQNYESDQKVENYRLEGFTGGEDFRVNSSAVLCRNR